MMKCETCRYLGKQSKTYGTNPEPMDVPACRRYAPRTVSGTGTGYSAEMFPCVDPQTDWCGDWLDKDNQ